MRGFRSGRLAAMVGDIRVSPHTEKHFSYASCVEHRSYLGEFYTNDPACRGSWRVQQAEAGMLGFPMCSLPLLFACKTRRSLRASNPSRCASSRRLYFIDGALACSSCSQISGSSLLTVVGLLWLRQQKKSGLVGGACWVVDNVCRWVVVCDGGW